MKTAHHVGSGQNRFDTKTGVMYAEDRMNSSSLRRLSHETLEWLGHG
jgi:hypothetical protein